MDTKRIGPDEFKKNEELLGEIIRKGGLVAFPTETVYGLGANALMPEAARKIYEAKGRPSDNPLIVHIAGTEALTPLVRDVPANGRLLMDAFWPGPLTLIFFKSALVPQETTGGLDTVAIRMPASPLALSLIQAAKVPIAAPSANLSGRPSPTTAAHVWEDMAGRIEAILDGGETDIGIESTIVDLTGKVPTILRPGFITRDMLEAVVGEVEVDPGIGSEGEAVHPKAPGMKYRHYAPKAPMILVEGDMLAAAAYIVDRLEGLAAEGHHVAVLYTSETQKIYEDAGENLPGTFLWMGSRDAPLSIAHNLYRCLRECDELAVDLILCESMEGQQPLMQSIMNRLKKAAGNHWEQAGGGNETL